MSSPSIPPRKPSPVRTTFDELEAELTATLNGDPRTCRFDHMMYSK